MAIERYGGSGSEGMDNPPMDDSMEDSTDSADQGGSEETVDIPEGMLEGQTVEPGDVVRLEVVSVNSDSGTVTAKYASNKPRPSAIDKAAHDFKMEA